MKKMLKDLAIKNRSYRGFDESRRISREELLELVDVTRYVASASNLQPLKYALVYEKEQVEAVLALTAWAGYLKEMKLPKDGMHPTAFVVICHDKNVYTNVEGSSKEAGMAAQTLLLYAAEKDLGGCVIGSFKAEKLCSELKLAENLTPQLVLALGKPAEKIVLTQVGEDQDTKYYRDAEGTHYVPKRSLEDIVI